MRPSAHEEIHAVHRVGWLRAAVLGANDGIVSMASLLVGIGASNSDHSAVVVAGVAGLAAGAMSMAAGEFVSVSSQADLEEADLHTERHALLHNPEEELAELTEIYIQRGVKPDMAKIVAEQLTAHDALAAHARDELQIVEDGTQPLTAALSSGLSFTVGGLFPLLPAVFAPKGSEAMWVLVASVLALVVLGLTSARAGGVPWMKPTTRIVLWGLAAMAVTGGVGALFGSY